MTPHELHKLMEDVFYKEVSQLRKQGQEEYASSNDAFSNFKEQGKELGMDPKVILWVHAMKHKSGIASYLKGVKSQRENVRGRINDLIVYLFILRGLLDEEEDEKEKEVLRKKRAEWSGKGIFYTEAETREYHKTGEWPHELAERTLGIGKRPEIGIRLEDEEEKPKTNQEEPPPL